MRYVVEHRTDETKLAAGEEPGWYVVEYDGEGEEAEEGDTHGPYDTEQEAKTAAPEIEAEIEAETKLHAAHDAEAERRKAEFYNYGWGETEGSIASKTSKGILETNDNGDGTYSHNWSKR